MKCDLWSQKHFWSFLCSLATLRDLRTHQIWIRIINPYWLHNNSQGSQVSIIFFGLRLWPPQNQKQTKCSQEDLPRVNLTFLFGVCPSAFHILSPSRTDLLFSGSPKSRLKVVWTVEGGRWRSMLHRWEGTWRTWNRRTAEYGERGALKETRSSRWFRRRSSTSRAYIVSQYPNVSHVGLQQSMQATQKKSVSIVLVLLYQL